MAKRKRRTARSTALIRQARQLVDQAPKPAKVEVLPPAVRDVGDDLSLGQLGLVEIKLTEAEEQILSEPIDPKDVLIKPTKSPVPYVSHPTYTRWLNRAFGRTGWALVPISKPMKSGNSVVCPYVLHIHGQPVAYAMGEQEYFESNRDQTYGDALESTVASALRRCMKRLGVGLEMWDRRWLNAFIAEHCVRVKVQTKDGPKAAWRRKDDPKLPGEMGRAPSDGGDGDDRKGPQDDLPPAGHHAQSRDVITEPMLKRLWAIGANSGRSHDEIGDWLQKRFGFSSSKEITRDKYEFICAAIEAKGALPL